MLRNVYPENTREKNKQTLMKIPDTPPSQCERHQVCHPKKEKRQPNNKYANQNTKHANQNAQYAKQNTKYANSIES